MPCPSTWLRQGYDLGAGYWKIKNSWGAWWGEQGYMRMKMTGDGPGLCEWGWGSLCRSGGNVRQWPEPRGRSGLGVSRQGTLGSLTYLPHPFEHHASHGFGFPVCRWHERLGL